MRVQRVMAVRELGVGAGCAQEARCREAREAKAVMQAQRTRQKVRQDGKKNYSVRG